MKKKYIIFPIVAVLAGCLSIGHVISKESKVKNTIDIVYSDFSKISRLPTALASSSPVNTKNALCSAMYYQESEAYTKSSVSYKAVRFAIAFASSDIKDGKVYDLQVNWKIKTFNAPSSGDDNLVSETSAISTKAYEKIEYNSTEVLPTDFDGAYNGIATYTIRDIPADKYDITEIDVKADVIGQYGKAGQSNSVGLYLRNPVTSFGFNDSYIVDKGGTNEHWEHEIKTVAHYRNIGVFSYKVADSTYTASGDHFCDDKTVYKLVNDLDCGGVSPWYDATNSKYFDLDVNTAGDQTVGDFIFTGVLDGDGYAIKNITATERMGTKVSGDECDVGGLFDAVANVTFKNLILNNVNVNNIAAKPGAIIACGFPNQVLTTGSYYLHFSNVTVMSTCSLIGKQGCAAFVGYARNNSSDIEFIDCVNEANLSCTGSNVGAFLGSNSGGSNRTFKFENCINRGDIQAANLVGGFAGTQTGGCTWTIKDCSNEGNITGISASNIGIFNGQKSGSDIINYSGRVTNSGYVMVPSANITSARNNSYEFKSENVATNIHWTNEPENATKKDLGDKFVISKDLTQLTIDFDENTKVVQIGNASSLSSFTKIIVDVSLGPVDKFALSDSHMLSSGGNNVASQEKASFSELTLKEVTRVGWIKPTADTPTGTYQDAGTIKAKEAYECYLIPYSEVDNPLYSNGYHEDLNGGYYVVNNKGAEGSFTQIFSIWLTATWTVNVYNGDTLIACGKWNSPVAVGGAQTYFSNIYQA